MSDSGCLSTLAGFWAPLLDLRQRILQKSKRPHETLWFALNKPNHDDAVDYHGGITRKAARASLRESSRIRLTS
jgi:hypothetical protein